MAGEHDGDPWAQGPDDPHSWCEVCEGSHDDHAKWLAGLAEAIAAWSESAKSLEEELGRSEGLLRRMGAARLAPRGDADERARDCYRDIARLVARLRRVTDAAAWRARQEAASAAGQEG